MTNTQQRLDAYLAAEARILTAGISIRFGERQRQEAELAAIQKMIPVLEAQLKAEQGVRTGPSSLRHHTVVFNG